MSTPKFSLTEKGEVIQCGLTYEKAASLFNRMEEKDRTDVSITRDTEITDTVNEAAAKKKATAAKAAATNTVNEAAAKKKATAAKAAATKAANKKKAAATKAAEKMAKDKRIADIEATAKKKATTEKGTAKKGDK